MHDYSKEMWMVIGENRTVVLDRQKLNGNSFTRGNKAELLSV